MSDKVHRVKLEGNLIFMDPVSKQTLKQVNSKHVELDFSKVNFMDSVGIGLLIATANRIKEKKGSLRIIHVNKILLETMTICGLDKLIEIVGDQ